MCECKASYALKNKQSHSKICPIAFVKCKYCARKFMRKNLEIHIRSCTDCCSYCNKQMRKDQLSDHYEVCHYYWKSRLQQLETDKKYWTEAQQTIDELRLKLYNTENNLSNERQLSIEKQIHFDELIRKNEYHENQIRLIKAGLEENSSFYLFIFMIGFVFCLFTQKLIDYFLNIQLFYNFVLHLTCYFGWFIYYSGVGVLRDIYFSPPL